MISCSLNVDLSLVVFPDTNKKCKYKYLGRCDKLKETCCAFNIL